MKDCNKFPPFIPESPCDYKPKYPPMPPVRPICEGETPTQMYNHLAERVNVCIHTYNEVMAHCYATLDNLRKAAQENGAYYHKPDVWVEEGYSADDSAVYQIIHKAVVDQRGEPIFMDMKLAYDNTTNSQIEMGISDASMIEFADKIIPAIPMTGNGWYGKVYYKGAPIATADKEGYYTYGFTRSGVLKAYANAVSNTQLESDGIENSMGCSGVLVRDRQKTTGADIANIPNYGEKAARIVIGQNYETREVFILVCDKTDETNHSGMLSSTCANILINYGCDIAVEVCEGDNTQALDEGAPLLGDVGAEKYYAFWVITRKRFYCDDYVRELARLTQNFGATLWTQKQNFTAIASLKSITDKLAKDVLSNTNAIAENKTAITNLTNTVNTLTSEVNELTGRITAAEADILKVQNDITKLNTKQAEQGETIDDLNTSVIQLNTTVGNLSSNVTAIQGQIATINTNITKIIDGTTVLPYVRKDGGTMTGDLNMSGAAKFTQVAEATESHDVVTLNDLVKVTKGVSAALPANFMATNGTGKITFVNGIGTIEMRFPSPSSSTTMSGTIPADNPVAVAIKKYRKLYGITKAPTVISKFQYGVAVLNTGNQTGGQLSPDTSHTSTYMAKEMSLCNVVIGADNSITVIINSSPFEAAQGLSLIQFAVV